MSFTFRIITFILALLIAGKEVIAFGYAKNPSASVCCSAQESSSGDQWILETESEEESDDKEDDSFDLDKSYAANHAYSFHAFSSVVSGTSLSELKFLVRNTEFYIYVLNLRL